jgi:hypothetical protein
MAQLGQELRENRADTSLRLGDNAPNWETGSKKMVGELENLPPRCSCATSKA